MNEYDVKVETFIEKLLECGNYNDAAEHAGFARNKGRALYKRNLDEINSRMSESMTLMQVQAMKVVKDTMGAGAMAPKQELRLSAARDVMDRGGLAKRQAIDMAVSELPAVMVLPPKAPTPQDPSDTDEAREDS